MSSAGYVSFTLKFTPTIIIPEPQKVAVFIGHLTRDADLVAVEVVGLLAAFSVFVDVVLIGETAFVRTTMLYVGIRGFVRATACYFEWVIFSTLPSFLEITIWKLPPSACGGAPLMIQTSFSSIIRYGF